VVAVCGDPGGMEINKKKSGAGWTRTGSMVSQRSPGTVNLVRNGKKSG